MDDRNKQAWEYSNVIENIHDVGIVESEERGRLNRAKRFRITEPVRRGLIRYLVLVVDGTSMAKTNDFAPTRYVCCMKSATRFVNGFFDQNPMSQLATFRVNATKATDRTETPVLKIEKIADMSGIQKHHVEQLEARPNMSCEPGGTMSLAKVLKVANTMLRQIQSDYGLKEVVIMFNSLSTYDDEDIFRIIDELKKEKIRVNFICLAAEVYICKRICEITGGTMAVAKNTAHLNELLTALTIPPLELSQGGPPRAKMVYMGFPKMYNGIITSYKCPKCSWRASSIPATCRACNLTLQSSASLARSYHFLSPVQNFPEIVKTGTEPKPYETVIRVPEQELPTSCVGCMTRFVEDSVIMRCPKCQSDYCVDCDLFIHDSIHNCPMCPT